MSCITNNTCGCLYPSNTDCVFLKGIDANCLSINNGDLLSDAINKINTAICDFEPNPSGLVYIVDSCDSNITVSATPTGPSETTYTVCLNPSGVPADITNLETNVTALQNQVSILQLCAQNGVRTLTTSTPGLTVNPDLLYDPCGYSWSIDYTPVVTDGIIYNSVGMSSTSGVGGIQTLKSLPNYDFFDDNNISVGDEIRFEIIGSLHAPDAFSLDDIIIEFIDGVTVIGTETFSQLGNFGFLNETTSYIITGKINVEAITMPLFNSYQITCNVLPGKLNDLNSGTNTVVQRLYKKFSMPGGVELSNLAIKVNYANTSFSSSPENGVQKFMVEVRKKL